MDIILFGVILLLSLAFITLGLIIQNHTELSLIGFVFLFLLGLVILNNQVTYVVGTETNSTFNYTTDINNISLLTSSHEVAYNIQGPITLGGVLSHLVGYWLMIASFIGFMLVIIAIKGLKGDN